MDRFDVDAAIAERAASSLGLLTRTALRDLGLTDRQIQHRVRRRSLERVGGSVFRVKSCPVTWEQRVLASVLAAGPGAAASHMTAAGLWHFDGIAPGAVEVVVARCRLPSAIDGLVHRSRDLLSVDVTTARLRPLRHPASSTPAEVDVAVTTAARTLLDIAPRLGASALEAALDGACRRNQIYVPFLAWRLSELRKQGRPGVRAVEELLHKPRSGGKAESWLESAFLRLMRDAGLPPPRTQVIVRPGGGRRRIRLDCRWDDQRLVVEVDGHATHSTRRQRQVDAERDARLQLDGWRVARFTYEDVVERPEHVVAIVAAMLGLSDAA